VFTEKQKGKEASLKTQKEESLELCKSQGYTVEPHHIYVDAYTGTEYLDRPALTELREAARRGEFDVVVIYAFDRLSRNQIQQAVILDFLDRHNISLECVTENFDDSATGQFMRSARAFAAQLEHEKIRERTEMGRQDRLKNGQMIGAGIVTYGYMWNKDRTAYLINEQEARVICYIFALCKAGVTIRGIAGRLRSEGILNRDGKPIWHTATIQRYLRNPFYIGIAYQYKWKNVREQGKPFKKVVRSEEERVRLPDGVVPPILVTEGGKPDIELFEAVQQVLKSNRQETSRNNRDYKQGVLRAGYIKCGYCGNNMTMRSRRSGRKNENPCYICPKGNSGFGECKRPTISIEVLDPIVWEKVTERVMQLARNISWVDEQIEKLKSMNPREVEIPSIETRLVKVESTIRNLVAMSKKDLDPDTLDLVTNQLAEQSKLKKGLLEQQRQVEVRQIQWEEVAQVLAKFRKWCLETAGNVEDATYERKRDALKILGVRVQVWKTDHDPRYYIEMSPPSITKLLVSHSVQTSMEVAQAGLAGLNLPNPP